MKFAVIGEPCMDYIHLPGVKAEKRFGGILYSVVSLSVLSGNQNEVFPVMNLGEDEYENVTSFLSGFKNIRFDFINRSAQSTRVVNLYYKNSAAQYKSHETGMLKTYDREENSTKPTSPVEFELIEKALPEFDGILINLVSGVDITLDTLKKIRSEFKGNIHMDLHNLVMKTHEDGTRAQEPVDNWQEWCEQCDTLQMNESEISIMQGGKLHEYETAEKILASDNVKAIVITRGKLGVSMYRKKEKVSMGEKYFELDKTDLAAIEAPHFVDSTGCGDVFASAFFFRNSTNNVPDYNNSLNYANKIAGRKAALLGVEELQKLG